MKADFEPVMPLLLGYRNFALLMQSWCNSNAEAGTHSSTSIPSECPKLPLSCASSAVGNSARSRDLKVPGDIVNLSRARKVMELIESHMEATDTGCSNALKKVLDEIQYTHPRIHDVTYNTIHKHYLIAKRSQ